MRISVNCPSWHRPRVETLKYLSFCKVWVDEDEYDEYVRENPGARIVPCKSGIQGNLCRIRNHILREEFSAGADVVLIIDDDMQGVYYYESENGFAYEKHLVSEYEFLAFIEKYSIQAMDIGAKLWGINVSPDRQNYKQTTPFSTTSYIGGPFQCFIKGNACFYDERLPLKEDYDMTLQQCLLYRVVFRVNKFYYVVKQAKQAGGCATYRNYEREKEQLKLLRKKWGKRIIKNDISDKSHKAVRMKKRIDFNPIIYVPIRGV